MMMEDKGLFEKHWEKFTTILKGKMMKHLEKQKLTYPVVKLLLSDTVLDWESEYNECGRWLINYCRQNPEKGEQIRSILLDNICFTEILQQKDYSEALSYVVPAAGALVGFGLSSFYHAGIIVKAISTIAPAAVLYPSAKVLGKEYKENNKSALIDMYMEQLEKYKQSVISIMEG